MSLEIAENDHKISPITAGIYSHSIFEINRDIFLFLEDKKIKYSN